jgi:hypothetical protein
MTGASSKLTLTSLFFLVDPASDGASDASLDVALLCRRPFDATGELPLEKDCDDFKADLAGEMERGGG